MIPERKRKTKDPCPNCYLHRERCICESIPTLNLKTRLCLVVHAKELKRTTNTGRLAIKSLVNSEMRIRGVNSGNTQEALDLSDLLVPEYRTLLFYPSEDAVALTKDFIGEDPRPIQLIVPDGSWRQASKVHYRHHELKDVPRVMIKTPNTAVLHMRTETTPEGMATLEAIAQAMGIIEGDFVGQELMKLYNAKLENTLIGRGQLKKQDGQK
ncbi:tRNA-uridine aminocarboxypropyltransferase [Bdellovibrio svalbardensis]|uniref:tRNA-uridine aminocarboxypropyltransferase n=1 Tax=Bdellovibrio svalbardensis TaxID=2972972 RepID=A0ABT6DJ27_9BACT|nr:tRNA-uridine aminocarboxypropyltransferase [Bdellovibrio svalbardensis]MDG0816862.1 DTW domain-containing protein [Bdellovibrio svalbardensis]